MPGCPPTFDGFALDFIEVSEAVLRVRHGGKRPPLLLLHGHPRTHTTWWHVSPLLAEHLQVVCPDLRGFGQSSKPKDTADHAESSKRAKAKDCVELMAKLGFERFFLAGHDRGSYTAFRLAMDHPCAVERLVLMDGVPIIEALERCSETFARLWWHWFFFCQPEKPERAILADPVVRRYGRNNGRREFRRFPCGDSRSRNSPHHDRGLPCGPSRRPCPRRGRSRGRADLAMSVALPLVRTQ